MLGLVNFLNADRESWIFQKIKIVKNIRDLFEKSNMNLKSFSKYGLLCRTYRSKNICNG